MFVAEDLADCIQNVKRASERLLWVRMILDKRLVNFISAYAPQAGLPDKVKEEFWNKAYELVGAIPPGEGVFLGGDLNGHVGELTGGYDGVHGGKGFGTKNAEGESILEFGSAMELAVCNTFFNKPEDHLVTYASGNARSQIDYVMVRKKDRKTVSNVKVIPGIECVQQSGWSSLFLTLVRSH